MEKLSKKDKLRLEKILKEHRKKNMDALLKSDCLIKTTRAGKLLLKGKRFIVVAIDEPYFMNVYKIIRRNEMLKGNWQQKCEEDFRSAFNEWLKSQ